MCEKTCFTCSKVLEIEEGRVSECGAAPFNDKQAEPAEDCEWDETKMPSICKEWTAKT